MLGHAAIGAAALGALSTPAKPAPPPAQVGYQHYRVSVSTTQGGGLLGCGKLELRLAAGGADILNTGNPSTGTATASSEYGGYPASAAFTGLVGVTGWLNGGGEAGWLQWDTGGAGIDVTGFMISARVNEPGRAPKTFTLDYSDDGAAWTTATAYDNQTAWGNTETRYFASHSKGAHRYWRINITAANGGGYVGIGCLCLGTASGDAIITDPSGRKALIDSQSDYGGGYEAVNVAQNDPSKYFVSAGNAPQWLDVYLPVYQQAAELAYTVHAGEQARAPTDFIVQGWNGAGFDLLQEFQPTNWASGEQRTFELTAPPPVGVSAYASEARVMAVSTVVAQSINLSEARTLAVYRIPSLLLNASAARGLLTVKRNSPIEVSEVRTVAVVRGRTANPRVRAWTFTLDGHDFYVLRLGDTETLVFDNATKQWTQWDSFKNGAWRPNVGMTWVGAEKLGFTYGSTILAGDDTFGLLWLLDPELPYDQAPAAEYPHQEIPFTRIAMGQVPVKGRNVIPCFAVFLDGDNYGLTSPDFVPGVQLETSDDQGQSFQDQGTIQASLDPTAVNPYQWLSLGQIGTPGRLFRITDNGVFARIDGMEMNDDAG